MKTLVERICPICGKSFFVAPATIKNNRGKVCSPQCQYIKIGQRDTRLTVTCDRCGKEFKRNPHAVNRHEKHYCSRACKHPPVIVQCLNCGKEFRTSPSSKSRYCSKICCDSHDIRNQQRSETVKKAWQSPEKRQRIMEGIARRSKSPIWLSAPHFQRGESNPRFKHDKKQNQRFERYDYKLWRLSVFRRDNFTCQKCGAKGGRIHAHHIQRWSTHPELRYEVSNGITLCVQCHSDVHGYSLLRQKPCLNCSKLFSPKNDKTKFCSWDCFVAYVKS